MFVRNLLLLLGAGAMIASADTTFTFGPTQTVSGPDALFKIFSASISLPTASDPLYKVVIQTNYGTTIPIPPLPNQPVIPSYTLREYGIPLTISDFLISWDGGFYGVVLGSHDGFTEGDLYKSPTGFETSVQATGSLRVPDGTDHVYINTDAQDVGGGKVTVTNTGDGVTSAMYTIVDEFSAPTGFLMGGNFKIEASSYACANGYISGGGGFPPLVTPEPGTFVLLGVPALFLAGFSLKRRYQRP